MTGNVYHCIYCNNCVSALYTQYTEEIIKMEHCPNKMVIKLILLMFFFNSITTCSGDNRVSVTLIPKWKTTPLLSEASEYVARESASAFWRFIDLISEDLEFMKTQLLPNTKESLSMASNRLLEKRVKDLAIQAVGASNLKNSSLEMHRRLFTLSVSSRMFSPTVEMSHQLALTGASHLLNLSRERVLEELITRSSGATWAHIGTEAVFSVDKLKEFIKSAKKPDAKPTLFPLDKIYSSKDISSDIPTVILHGDLSHCEFYSWHRTLKALSDDGLCIYVFRHYFQDRNSNKTNLNGYGVELALKSTEYKAMDDTKTEEPDNLSAKGTDKTFDVPVVAGFNFTQLQSIHPELKKELNEFHNHLLSTDDELRPLKAWQFRDLSLQASQLVMDAYLTDGKQESFMGSYINSGLWSLRDISQNLPARASRLVNVNVNPNIRKESGTNQYILSGTFGIQPGQSLLLLNGILLSPSVDIFALLDVVRHEAKMMAQLHDLGIPGPNVSQLITNYGLSSESASTSNEGGIPGSRHSVSGQIVLDLSSAPIVYINNLESDSAYAHWSSSFHTLFTLDFSGGIRRIRKNLHNVILVLDPASSESREMLKLTESFLLHMTAIRFGILWSVNPKVNSTGLILTRIFTYISSSITRSHESPFPVSIDGLGSPGAMAALSFLTEIYAHAEKLDTNLNIHLIKQKFEKLFPSADSEDIFSPAPGSSDYDNEVSAHHEFLVRSGLHSVNKIPLLLFNGIILDSEGIRKLGGFEDTVVTLCMEELMRVQSAVYEGRMSDSHSIFDLYQKTATVVPRFNARILLKKTDNSNQKSNSAPKYVNFEGNSIQNNPSDQKISTSQLLKSFLDQMRYFQKGDLEAFIRPVTMWIVVGDLDMHADPNLSVEHRSSLEMDLNLVLNALTYLRSSHSTKGLRIGLLFNPSESTQVKNVDSWLTRVLYLVGNPSSTSSKSNETNEITKTKYVEQMAARNFGIRVIKETLEAIKASTSLKSLEELSVSNMDSKKIQAALQRFDKNNFMQMHSSVASRIIGLQPGERAVVVNGRILGPLEPLEEFLGEDFRLAERMALNNGAKELGDTLQKIIGTTSDSPNTISELTWQMSSVLQSGIEATGSVISETSSVDGISDKAQNGRRMRLRDVTYDHSGFIIQGNESEPNFELVAIMDPASRDAQRLSHILIVLQHSLPCTVKVLLNPTHSLSELPVKSFYRFVWEPSLFPKNESAHVDSAISPRAYFTNLPGQSLLTLGMDEPHGWMVAAVEAVQDLDNLRLIDYRSNKHLVEAVFELEHLLLEGHCIEEANMKPPRGLQFTLGPTPTTTSYDTIVMANLGYFQLKANPGAWYLNIRAGKSQKLYEISGQEHTDSPSNSSEIITLISNFRSKIIGVYVSKRAGHAGESMLDDTSDETTSNSWLNKHSEVWSTLSNYAEEYRPSWLTGLKRSLQAHLPWGKCTSNQETINIFSVASGHLYERLLRIMMLTVIRHTNSPVKFWFLKNYLSPTFKDFIPYMAAEYGFEYEFVQYKWPRWLHAQTEKQRIIWGYKILFLDVLFPLNVTKIIFVDADQIVRADLKELADLDLGGAPYGYTPFCDSRKEMDGFRFWKQGYWANHLAGRPYHISALYVVDLTRFRRLAAGDRLRGQYHGLSQDPNSLSNLDQDLPNNMIHQVPIKSLPQEWLWCETWCSDESLAQAKTIDLCNNPRTKEPKLTAAMRIAPEWVDYDREIKKLWKRVYPSTSDTSPSGTTPVPESTIASPISRPPSSKESTSETSKVDDHDVKTEL
ncbi:unnamed protein product [Heterobilharzia americana]|nr:unnamed protein product [Heterobilharzia americana]